MTKYILWRSFIFAIVFSMFSSAILAQNGQVVAAVKKDGRWGYVDTLGKMVIPFNLEAAGNFFEGLAAVKYGGHWGYINKKGDFSVKPVFDEASDFHDGHARITFFDSKDSVYYHGYINRISIMPISLEYYETGSDFHDGLVKILTHDENGSGFGFKDTNNTWVIKPRYDGATDFHEGKAAVELGHVWGYIDEQNNQLVFPKYDEAWYYQEQLAYVKEGNTTSFLDPKGNTAFSVKYDEVDLVIQDGMISFRDKGKIGFLDKKGKVVIKPRFEGKALTRFKDGLAPIQGENGRFGYIDKTGKFVIQPQFEDAQLFFNNYALVKLNGKFGYIDRKGNWIVKPEYESAYEFEPADQ
jgi:hypothetical protein